jgi:hypothetical protein
MREILQKIQVHVPVHLLREKLPENIRVMELLGRL